MIRGLAITLRKHTESVRNLMGISSKFDGNFIRMIRGLAITLRKHTESVNECRGAAINLRHRKRKGMGFVV
ncbi:hypothetical protein FCV25MIE_28303 [Fagus crenata]